MVVHLDDVVGLEKQKELLYNAVILPQLRKETYSQLVKRPDIVNRPNTFLFYGPPGTGKTLLANALANDLDMHCESVQATQFLNEYVGKGASWLRNVYDGSEKVVFIDEIDAIGRKREKSASKTGDDILIQLLLVLDSASSSANTTSILATNRYDILDDALLSRIPTPHQIKFDLPDYTMIKALFDKYSTYYQTDNLDTSYLAKVSEGFDGRQIASIVNQACYIALAEDKTCIQQQEMITSIKRYTNVFKH